MITVSTKPVNVEVETHERIMRLGRELRKNTGLRHPAYVVVQMAVSRLEDALGINPFPSDNVEEP